MLLIPDRTKIIFLKSRIISNSTTSMKFIPIMIISFLNEVVSADYERFGTISENYRDDVEYNAQVSGDIGSSARELAESVRHINDSLENISKAQQSLNESVSNTNATLEQISAASGEIASATQDALRSTDDLTNTVSRFNIDHGTVYH